MKYIFANWKMYLGVEESKKYIQKIASMDVGSDDIQVVVFPNALVTGFAQDALASSPVAVGAQNVNWAPQGAYTGATSAALFEEVGCTYALVGHSERRYIFNETDEAVRSKIEACLEAHIIPVLCVGETAEDREGGKQEYRVKKQLMKALEGLTLENNQLCVAYEPVWAISKGGVGEQCGVEHVSEMISLIRSEIAQYTDAQVPVVYGGSVNEENVLLYASLDGVDGVLPGHASTNLESLSAIVRAVASV